MDFLPIQLGVTRIAGGPKKRKGAGPAPGSSSFLAHPTGKDLDSALKQRIFQRDENRCRCCGFASEKYQQILFKNGNLRDHRDDNLATTCIFCHQCFHLETVRDMKSGALIWLPEIEPWQLHHIARAVYVARISQGPVADAARKIHDILLARRDEAARRISTDDPYILATVMQDYLSTGIYAQRSKKLEGIRLLPLDRRTIKEAELEFNQFPQILAYWRSKNGPFAGQAPGEWISLYQDLMAKAA